jgi:hypothetical protein
MNLTDKEILELNELCNAVVDETISEKQRDRLSEMLRGSLDARQFYVRSMGLSASLHSYAAEMQMESPDGPSQHGGHHRGTWLTMFFALAALVMLVIWLKFPHHDLPRDTQLAPAVALGPNPPATLQVVAEKFVAQLTGSKGCEWRNGTIQPGGQLHEGQKLELTKGLAEITFDCGAQVVLEGPASFSVNTEWNATLSSGSLRASLPPEAMGFSISNPTVEVVDNGTEFTMVADASGASTDVYVIKGEVVASPNAQSDQTGIVLREKESRRFSTSGVQKNVQSNDLRLAELARPLSLDHFAKPAGYAHWSFDQAYGKMCKVEAFGLAPGVSDLKICNVAEVGLPGVHTPGRFGGALKFNGGKMFAQAEFPGISDYTAHTVSFWVKIPSDASLSNTFAMIAWGVNNPQLGSHPIDVVWNKDPDAAMVGVLRTNFFGGFAVGRTPLRDGKWHHIAVVLVPRVDPRGPLDVKQYVDGRLQGEARPSQTGSDIFLYSSDNTPQDANGNFWLGCRVGQTGPKAARFVGEISDLFVFDRALEPQEIVKVMSSNQMQY